MPAVFVDFESFGHFVQNDQLIKSRVQTGKQLDCLPDLSCILRLLQRARIDNAFVATMGYGLVTGGVIDSASGIIRVIQTKIGPRYDGANSLVLSLLESLMRPNGRGRRGTDGSLGGGLWL